MNRGEWLAERRAAVERSYTLEAPTYDVGYDPATPVHRLFVARLIETCPRAGVVLDAPCGTGAYVDMVIGSGRDLVGADQSAGMLAAARAKHPAVRFEQIGLQELAFEAEFDAAMCVDAMENVPPEEWPLVLGNLRRAVRPGCYVYLTVEEIERATIDAAFAEMTAAGLPAVYGEVVEGDTAGYHFYADRDRIDGWLGELGLDVIDDVDEWLDGYGYRHLLLRTPG